MSNNNDDDVKKQHHDDMIRETYNMYAKYHNFDQSAKLEEAGNLLGISNTHGNFPMFRPVEKTGVIYATTRARENGFTGDEDESSGWANMGQGAPETGPLPGAPSRDYSLHIPYPQVEYAPNTGVIELREKVAAYYNHLYRGGKDSKYSAANVCIVPGGRAGLTRIMAVLSNTQVGYFSPDYTAYEQALGLFERVTPSVYLHRDTNEPIMLPEEFEFQTVGRGIGAVLLSNPANPTGQSIEGDNLKEYVDIARNHDVALIMDEFYSHYYYDGPEEEEDDSSWPKTVSSANYIEDVNKDPILIVNGLTKNWRCPGFRCCWVVAPAQIVELLGSAGSFLDGGTNAPIQRLALPLMDLDFIRRDAWALQKHFRQKRDFLLDGLARLGINVALKPNATFYVWADLSNLPPPLNDGLVFLEECTKHKIIIVPGVFFDCNPRSVRHIQKSKCISNVRFSYGPPMENLKNGVKNLESLISKYQKTSLRSSTYMLQEVRDELQES